MLKKDPARNGYMLRGALSRKGYDWWWHNFTGKSSRTGEEKTFFIEYFVCNPALGGRVPILGQLPENIEKGTRPSYALVKAGWWGKDAAQLHNFYGIDEFSGDPARLNVRMGECSLSETRMIGTCAVTDAEAREHPEYMCGAGSMSWDLSIDKKIPFNVGYGASPFVRSLNAFEMFWHAEGMKTEYSGTVVLNGGTYRIEPQTSFGYADKNWGADFTSPWLWISSCDLVSLQSGKRLDNSAVEIGGGNPKVYGFSLGRKLLGSLVYQGVEYEFNFSRFWTGSSVRFSFTEGEKDNVWTVRAKSRKARMELELRCPKDEMLLINYEAPSGKKLHNRLWNGGTGVGEIRLYTGRGTAEKLVDRIEMRHVGCEYGEYGAESEAAYR